MDQNDEFRGWLSNTYPNLVAQALKCKLVHVISGRHSKSNSGKVHWHINMIIETEEKEARKYKDFGSKFRRLKINIPKEYKDLFPENYKIKYYYDSSPDYDESCMGYPLKEYCDFTEIPLMLQYGYTDDELEKLRQKAHKIWIKKFKEYEAKKKEELSLQEYLDDNVKFDNEVELNPLTKIRKVIRQILFYRKLQNQRGETKSIQLTRLRDQATSYLYFKNLITESDILEELRI